VTLTPNDFYNRSCEISGHILGSYKDTKRCIFCGKFENQQEDNMCTVCEKGGCSNCEPRNETLQFASGKEIEEFYDSYGESLWVDPAESTPESL
jgi:hypothetical protein